MMGLSTMTGFVLPASASCLVLAYGVAHGRQIWTDPVRMFGLLGAFTYLLAATLYIRFNVHPLVLDNDGILNRHYPLTYSGQVSFVTNLQFPLSAAIVVAATLLSLKWLDNPRRRLLSWWCLIYAGLFLNPLSAYLLMEHLTTSNVYWRLFHAYPIPLVIGIAAGLLDADDVFARLGQALDSRHLDGDVAAAGDAVKDDRQLGRPGDFFEMLEQALLRWLVVIRRNLQRAVCANGLGGLGEVNCLGGGVGAGAGQDLHPALGRLHSEFDDTDVLVETKRGRLSGSSDGDDPIDPPTNLILNEFLKSLFVNAPLPERRDNGGVSSCKHCQNAR